jgi:SAM-dependent methyltransferase
MTDPTKRFSSRVANYVKYRPGYPPEVVDLLKEDCGFTRDSVVADVGSGTGNLTRVFLDRGNVVFAVEPNTDMRAAAERSLSGHVGFRSVDARAEATTLPDRGVDFITAGQAFHWFDRVQTRPEFARILKPGGWVVLVWNDRKNESSDFLEAYDQLLHSFAREYKAASHRELEAEAIWEFFTPGGVRLRKIPSRQVFNFDGILGRLMSSSYAPEAGHPQHVPMVAELERLFYKHQTNGSVAFEYDTLVYYGQLQVVAG